MLEDLAGPLVVCSVLEADAAATLRAVEAAPAGCGLVEIRADHLHTDELVALVARIARPLIVTIRRAEDGGAYGGSEAERRSALRSALAAGARLIDVEIGGPAEELLGTLPADKVIVSHHGSSAEPDELRALYRRMCATTPGRLKIVPRADFPGQAAALRQTLALASRDGRALACFATGRAGALTRLLSCAWGSWATYGSLRRGAETARGQFPARDLLEVYDVTHIGRDTRLFALLGTRVFSSPSPAMHRAAYVALGLDARYLPVELDRFRDCLPLVGPDGAAGFEALAVTMPFKERAAARSTAADEISAACGVVNTVLVRESTWIGHNTDGPAAVSLARARLPPRGLTVAVAGAGGTARALGHAFARAGATVTLFARDPDRGGRAARAIGVDLRAFGELDEARWDILVNATPLGGAGEAVVAPESLRGRLVLDAVYSSETTPLVREARRRGLAAIDGYELLVAQATRQFRLMTGASPDRAIMDAAGKQWLNGPAC